MKDGPMNDGINKLSEEFGMSIYAVKDAVTHIMEEVIGEQLQCEVSVKIDDAKTNITYKKDGTTGSVSTSIISEYSKHMILPKVKRRLKEIKANDVINQFDGKEGMLFNCTVVSKTFRGILVKSEGATGIIENRDQIPGEEYKVGDEKLAILKKIDPESSSIIYFSRNGTAFIDQVLRNTIPAIASGEVSIVKIARVNGTRTKIVVGGEGSIGKCLGLGNKFYTKISDSIQPEKIRFIEDNPNMGQYLINTLSNSKNDRDDILSVFFDNNSAYVEAEEDAKRRLIGYGGSNVKMSIYLQKGSGSNGSNGSSGSIKSIYIYNPEEFKEAKDAIIKDKIDKYILKFSEGSEENMKRSSELRILCEKHEGIIESSDIDNNIELRDAVAAHEVRSRRVEEDLFVEQGGSRDMIKLVIGYSMEILYHLEHCDIISVEQISSFNSYTEFASYTNLSNDIAMLIHSRATELGAQ